jgi:ubiquinone/menaquinone biosynthesis C-methylase UbiE
VEWDSAYKKRQNFCFYPNEELVKFLNRYIKKKIGQNEYINILGDKIECLDFGCGIGASTSLISDFGISCIGVDISKVAVDYAKELYPNCNFEDINSDNLSFDDKYFDFSISVHCLDSMDNSLTNKIMSELIRVTKKYIFITLISSHELNDINFDGQIVVNTEHEKDTIHPHLKYFLVLFFQ